MQPGPSLGSAPPALAMGPKRTGLSTLVGSEPCPPSLQRGLWVPLVSQLSGSHCAPVTVQGNLGMGKTKRGKKKRRVRTEDVLLSPSQDPPTPHQEGTGTVTGRAAPPSF